LDRFSADLLERTQKVEQVLLIGNALVVEIGDHRICLRATERRRRRWEKAISGIVVQRERDGENLSRASEDAIIGTAGVSLNRLREVGGAAIMHEKQTLPPATEVGNRRRSGLTSAVSEDVFALRTGEVSRVEKEAYSFVVYKVDAKWTLPEERVREEISREIIKQKLDTALKSVTEGIRTDLNENYLGSAAEQ